jgi:uncharacterized protein
MTPDPAVLQELVRRVVDSVHPLTIILFGSPARGEMGPNSDLDALVVVGDQSDCYAVNKVLARKVRGLGFATDIVVVRQADLDQYGANPYLVLHTALSEGKELYRAASYGGLLMGCKYDDHNGDHTNPSAVLKLRSASSARRGRNRKAQGNAVGIGNDANPQSPEGA